MPEITRQGAEQEGRNPQNMPISTPSEMLIIHGNDCNLVYVLNCAVRRNQRHAVHNTQRWGKVVVFTFSLFDRIDSELLPDSDLAMGPSYTSQVCEGRSSTGSELFALANACKMLGVWEETFTPQPSDVTTLRFGQSSSCADSVIMGQMVLVPREIPIAPGTQWVSESEAREKQQVAELQVTLVWQRNPTVYGARGGSQKGRPERNNRRLNCCASWFNENAWLCSVLGKGARAGVEQLVGDEQPSDLKWNLGLRNAPVVLVIRTIVIG